MTVINVDLMGTKVLIFLHVAKVNQLNLHAVILIIPPEPVPEPRRQVAQLSQEALSSVEDPDLFEHVLLLVARIS